MDVIRKLFFSRIMFCYLTTALFLTAIHAEDSHNFTLNLYKSVLQNNSPGKNVALSPFSIQTALTMTYFGAAGTTKSEMASVMGINDTESADSMGSRYKSIIQPSKFYTLDSANAVYVEKNFAILPTFRDILVKKFASSISSADFASNADGERKAINAFVESATKNKIHDLLPVMSLDSVTKLVLVNAIYFKADWEKEFLLKDTTVEPFTLLNGDQVNVSMMHRMHNYRYAMVPHFGSAVELNYKNGDGSMIVILPHRDKNLTDFESELNGDILDQFFNRLRNQSIDVFLPKFNLSTGYALKEPLKTIGMLHAFDDADFSGISPEPLVISKVQHKVFLQVDEKGTVAAAATAVVQRTRSSIIRRQFVADRPFVFLIRHNPTNTILFMGRVVDPTTEE